MGVFASGEDVEIGEGIAEEGMEFLVAIEDDEIAIADEVGEHGGEEDLVADALFSKDDDVCAFFSVPGGERVLGVVAIHSDIGREAVVVFGPAALVVS